MTIRMDGTRAGRVHTLPTLFEYFLPLVLAPLTGRLTLR